MNELETSLLTELLAIAAKILKVAPDELDGDAELLTCGFTSMTLTDFTYQINEQFDLCFTPSIFFAHKNLQDFASFLLDEYQENIAAAGIAVIDSVDIKTDADAELPKDPNPAVSGNADDKKLTTSPENNTPLPVAIVGMSGCFPGAPDIATYWDNLVSGRDCMGDVPASRWDWRDVNARVNEGEEESALRWGGFIDGVEQFDPLFFGISPREAKLMDPQQRLLLMHTWKALEDAGHNPDDLAGSNTGLFMGVVDSEYGHLAYDSIEALDSYSSTGSVPSMAVNRLSYFLDFHGPSEPVETACSSSLVVIHKAINAISLGECDIAIVGGVNTILSPREYISFNKAGMLSRDGRCKTFSAQANGYARGEGLGVLVLRSLALAEAQGDPIHAVVVGSAVNHGGRSNSLTAPSPVAQANVIQAACERMQLDPRSIGCIEAHGTGTVLGDPVEIDGLKLAFDRMHEARNCEKPRQPYCGIGSVKSNIGHLEMAAGVAGVIKVVLQLQHRQLVKTLHCDEINPYIGLEQSPFYVLQSNQPWTQQCKDNGETFPRRGGVSSFGFGGVNSHVILEEYIPEKQPAAVEQGRYIVPLSAKKREALTTYAANLKDFIANNRVGIEDLAYTLQVGRQAMSIRRALIVDSIEDLLRKLDSIDAVAAQDIYASEQVPAELNPIDDFSRASVDEVAKHWVAGGDVPWSELDSRPNKRRVNLPTYPFVTQRYWFENAESSEPLVAQTTSSETVNRPTPPHTSIWESDAINSPAITQSDVVTLSIVEEQIAIITMADRGACNMFSTALLSGLQTHLAAVQRNKSLKAVIITGYDNIFCVGGTREGLLSIAQGKSQFTDSPILYRGLLELDIPVVAAIQGHAFGGGFLFGLYADICVLADEAIYSSNFMQYGFTPGMGATYILEEKLGRPLARELMFTANNYDGKTLKERGIPLPVVPQAKVLDEAVRYARQLAKKPRGALVLLKRELCGRMLALLQDCIESEVAMHEETFRTQNVMQEIHQHFSKLEQQSVSAEATATAAIQPNPGTETQTLTLTSLDDAGSGVTASTPLQLQLADLGQQVPTATTQAQPAAAASGVSKAAVRGAIADILVQRLFLEPEAITSDSNFRDLGVDSIAGVEIIRDLNQVYDIDMEAVVLYDRVTIDALAGHVISLLSTHAASNPPAHEPTPTQANPAHGSSDQSIRIKLRTILSKHLHLDADDIADREKFRDMGVDSIAGVEIIRDVNRAFALDLEAVVLYDKYTVEMLAAAIAKQVSPYSSQPVTTPVMPVTRPVPESSGITTMAIKDLAVHEHDVAKVDTPRARTDIAIVGMAGRFPRADDLDSYWRNIAGGVDCIQPVPAQKWHSDQFYSELPIQPGKSYSRWMGAINDFDKFDAAFFNITPHEATAIDPQQRVFLETAWHAIEDAGYNSASLSHLNCSVYVGAGHGDYGHRLRSDMSYQAHMLAGSSTSILASRLPYLLNLQGQAVAIDTACSSSLVALHEACKSIRCGESDMCIAGGVYISTTEEMHVQTSQAKMLAQDGRCKTFDDSADGFVVGEGAGVVVLKPLDRAIADRDNIHGVIKGTGVNQDGATNGITAPSASSQTRLIKAIYKQFGIDPGHIGLVEAHGTGTELGDPIEVRALTDAFDVNNGGQHHCAIGSVKTNIGHALAAAGVAGLLKVVLALKHRQLPPSLNFSKPNRHINFDASPFYVNTELCEWHSDDPRQACVSSFGFSGTNAHAVVEEYSQAPPHGSVVDIPLVFVFSAKNSDRLTKLLQTFNEYLTQHEVALSKRLADIAYTLQVGRDAMEERVGFVAQTFTELQAKIAQILDKQFSESQIHHGNTKQSRKALENLNADGEMDAVVQQWLASGDINNVLNVWVKGLDVNWQSMYAGHDRSVQPGRISLPLYPFYRNSYWVDTPVRSINGDSEEITDMVSLGQAIESQAQRDIEAQDRDDNVGIQATIVGLVAEATGIEREEVEIDEHFLEMGADSIVLMSMIAKVQDIFNVEISNTDLYENYYSIELLAEYICESHSGSGQNGGANSGSASDVQAETSVLVSEDEEILTI